MQIFLARPMRLALESLLSKAKAGIQHAETQVRLIAAELAVLRALDGEPEENTPELKAVVQARKHKIWRLSHPFMEGYAVRVIVWFTDAGEAVVALFHSDKAGMGDVFYDTVGERADQAIDEWLMNKPKEER